MLTHGHPAALESAAAAAIMVALALVGAEPNQMYEVVSQMCCSSSDDFVTAILEAINTDGDSDSIGTITGSVIGARLGVNAIPMHWRASLENSDYLHRLGRRLRNSRYNFPD